MYLLTGRYISTGAHNGQEEETEPPEAELQVIVSQMAWMLELDLESCRSLMLCSLKG